MSDNDSDTNGNRDGLFQRIVIIACGLAIVTFVFWLVADQDIIATQSPYDDEWFLQKGRSAYWLDNEPYSPVKSFLKEPPYPLFIAVTFRLGIPLYLAHLAFYFAAAALLSRVLIFRTSAAWVGLIVFAALALHPLPNYVFRRSVHDGIYTSLLLMAAAALIWQLKCSGEPGAWLRWLVSGAAFGLLWNTRQERPLALVLIGVAWVAGIAVELSRRERFSRAVRSWLIEWTPPVAITAAITVAFMAANYHRWGVFALTDMSAPNFRRAYEALIRIKPKESLPYVSITKDMREHAYEVSPSFRELKPYLEGSVWQRRVHAWQTLQDIPPYEYSGGWFVLCLRDAVESAGLAPTAVDAEKYYGRVADEINSAIDNGLPTQWISPVGAWSVHPDWQSYYKRLWPSWRKVWFSIWSFSGMNYPQADDDGREGKSQFVDHVARRRADQTVSERGLRARLRESMWRWNSRFTEGLFASSFIVAALVLLIPRAVKEWGWYVMPALMFGAYGFARTISFVIFDASMFPGTEIRYLLPCTVSFVVVATWLWADGVRRVLGAAITDADGSSNLSRWRWLRTLLAMLCIVISILLFAQLRDQSAHPPDTHEFVGIVKADAEKISGWARLKEDPQTSVEVMIFVDGELAGIALADQLDIALPPQRIGTGWHGFSMDTPVSLKDGKPHTITAKIKGTNYVLWQSPLTVTFPLK